MKEYVGAELLTEWQTRLGLHDWTIKLVDNCNPDEMTIQDAVGCVDAKRGTDSKSVCGVNNDIRSTDEEHLSDDLCEDEKETETVNGKWRKGIGENGVTTSLFCPNCHYENKHWDNWNFCPNCGENMRAE